MNSEWVEITKKQNKIYVSIKLPIFDRHGSVGKLKITRAMVESLLASRKMVFDKFIEGPAFLRNTTRGSNKATWIFECVKKVRKPKQATPAKAPAKPKPDVTPVMEKNTEKTLDKSPESVIIKVEEKQLSQKEE